MAVIENLVTGINRRISSQWASRLVVKWAAPYYNESIAKSGFTDKLVYVYKGSQATFEPEEIQKEDDNNLIQFSVKLSTNIIRGFLVLIKMHFPKTHRNCKFFNPHNK